MPDLKIQGQSVANLKQLNNNEIYKKNPFSNNQNQNSLAKLLKYPELSYNRSHESLANSPKSDDHEQFKDFLKIL